MELEDFFDMAKQIEVYENSSFMVTDEGALYSWGRNDHGFLGREAKLDIKAMQSGDKKKKLTFSTFTPGKIMKLEKFNIKRIRIDNGKFFAFLIDNIVDTHEDHKDSEIDTEEEKDVVEDFPGKKQA